MVNVVKIALDVYFDYCEVAVLNQLIHLAQSSFGTAARAEPLAAVVELSLKDQFNDLFKGGLRLGRESSEFPRVAWSRFRVCRSICGGQDGVGSFLDGAHVAGVPVACPDPGQMSQ